MRGCVSNSRSTKDVGNPKSAFCLASEGEHNSTTNVAENTLAPVQKVTCLQSELFKITLHLDP